MRQVAANDQYKSCNTCMMRLNGFVIEIASNIDNKIQSSQYIYIQSSEIYTPRLYILTCRSAHIYIQSLQYQVFIKRDNTLHKS